MRKVYKYPIWIKILLPVITTFFFISVVKMVMMSGINWATLLFISFLLYFIYMVLKVLSEEIIIDNYSITQRNLFWIKELKHSRKRGFRIKQRRNDFIIYRKKGDEKKMRISNYIRRSGEIESWAENKFVDIGWNDIYRKR